jgi:hypothetical protein
MAQQKLTTNNFHILRSPDDCRIEFRIGPPLRTIGVGSVMMVTLMALPIMGIVQRHNILLACLLLTLMTMYFVAFLWFPVRNLFLKPVVFDKLHNRVTRGERLLCDLTAVRRVERHHSFVSANGKGAVRRESLKLVTNGGLLICLITGVGYSIEEIQQIGQQIAAFTQVEFVDDDAPVVQYCLD